MSSVEVWWRVTTALMLREAVTRNGRFRFGYVYAFMEPAIYILAFVAFRQFLMAHTPFGDNAMVFMLMALLTFRTAMSLTRRPVGAIHSNIALLTFPQVKTFDVIVARIFLDAITWTATSLIFVFGLYIFGGVWPIASLEIVLAGYGATIFFGSSFGFFNAAFVRIFPFWEKILQILQLPLFILSGIFFLPHSLPPQALTYLWWNPYLHLVEWVRSGVYLDYAPFLSMGYVLTLSVVLLLMGLFFNKFFQRKMLSNE